MKLISKTQTELNIEEIEKSAEMFANSINTSIILLNLAYKKLWDLPEDQLRDVLNTLAQNNRLQSLFEDHNFAVNSLNSIASKIGGIPTVATSVVGNELQVDDNGSVTIVGQLITE
jgi:hypothetical protein